MTADQPYVALTFARRERSDTHWIEGEYDAAAKPEALLADLAAIGFVADSMVLPPYTNRDGVKVQVFHLAKPGTGLFSGWTPEEKKASMAAARRVLRKHGFVSVPVWTKTLADML